jgi:hypothetical protein
MSNYTKATNFATKDTLPTGDAGKIVKGTEIDNEFNAIASAVSSKADTASPTFTGTPIAPTAVVNTNTTQIATTAFVVAEITDGISDERTATATLTNKTLTSPTISTPTISTPTISGGSLTGVSLTEVTSLTLEGTTADSYETTLASEPTADRTITLPDATTTLVGRDTTDTLTNKSINASQLVDASITPAKLSGGQSGSAPIYAARAWANFDGTGSIGNKTINASGNVSTISKTSTGSYTLTFTTAMQDANYAVFVSSADTVSGTDGSIYVTGTKTTTEFNFEVTSGSSSIQDRADISVVVFR